MSGGGGGLFHLYISVSICCKRSCKLHSAVGAGKGDFVYSSAVAVGKGNCILVIYQ